MDEAEWKLMEERWIERNKKYLGDATPARGKPQEARRDWTPRKVAKAYCDRRGWDDDHLLAVIDRHIYWTYFEIQADDETDE